jgi:hypothetical protein
MMGLFSLHHRVQNGSGSHPWVPEALTLEVKRPGRLHGVVFS